MGKKHKGKNKKKRNHFPPPPVNNPPVINGNSDDGPRRKKKRFWVIVWSIIVVIGTIAGLIGFNVIDIYDRVTYDKKEAFYKETRVRGIFLNPQIVQDKSEKLYVFAGSNYQTFPISALKRGVEYQPNSITIDSVNPVFDLSIKIIEGRLYVKTSFKDIENKHVGDIDFRNWSLMIENITDWFETDSTFEVFDSGKNIIFGIAYRHPNVILLKGYFVFPKFVCVFTDGMYPFSKETGKEKALQKIAEIKSGKWFGDNMNVDSLQFEDDYMIKGYYEYERKRVENSIKEAERKSKKQR